MAATDAEKQPLLEEGKGEGYNSENEENELQEPDDSMSYDARKLVSFEVFKDLSGTVWTKTSLWKMMAFLVLISLTVSLIVACSLKDPGQLDVAKFQQISGFLKVIVGLLLGFFLSNSVQRWYNCTNGFLELFDAIRGLHMQLNALGVPKERIYLVLRYCIVSAHCLNNDLNADCLPAAERKAFEKERWDMLVTTDKDSAVAWKHPKASLAKIYSSERKILAKLEDPAQTLWVWVTSLITRMSADGEIPPMPTPTYGRIIAIAEMAYNGIRTVRASVCVQPPYVHVQMMATLVCVNNIINAMSFGMTLGVTVSGYLARYHLNPATDKVVSSADLSAQLQDLLIGFILATLGPFLYQALLEVAVAIAQPFAAAGKNKQSPGRIPTDKLLFQLEKDLRDAELMSASLPWWDQPYFKAPAQ